MALNSLKRPTVHQYDAAYYQNDKASFSIARIPVLGSFDEWSPGWTICGNHGEFTPIASIS